MTLSPAAQSVMNAHHTAVCRFTPHAAWGNGRPQIAAILQALADHKQTPIVDGQPIDHWNPSARTRRELRNIAAELQP